MRCPGAPRRSNWREHVVWAAALRIVQFPTSNEFRDWDTALHSFTFANAVEQGLRRSESPELVRGIFDAAMSVYLNRFLNVPAVPLAGGRAGEGSGRVIGPASRALQSAARSQRRLAACRRIHHRRRRSGSAVGPVGPAAVTRRPRLPHDPDGGSRLPPVRAATRNARPACTCSSPSPAIWPRTRRRCVRRTRRGESRSGFSPARNRASEGMTARGRKRLQISKSRSRLVLPARLLNLPPAN